MGPNSKDSIIQVIIFTVPQNCPLTCHWCNDSLWWINCSLFGNLFRHWPQLIYNL